MIAGCDLLANVFGSELLDYGRARVVHTDNHRARAALARQALDDDRSIARPQAHTTNVFSTEQTEQAGFGESADSRARKFAILVNIGSVGPSDLGRDFFQCGQILRHFYMSL